MASPRTARHRFDGMHSAARAPGSGAGIAAGAGRDPSRT
jgi:hypothetical protein